MIVLAGCYAPTTADLSCVNDNDCLGLSCVGQFCRDRGPSEAVSVAVGPAHVCAALGDGSIRCWGSNRYGQLGYPDRAIASCQGETPAALGRVKLGDNADGLHVLQVAAGSGLDDGTRDIGHTCALLSNGRLKCWGLASAYGDPMLLHAPWLGYESNDSIADPAKALFVPLAQEVRKISLGNRYTCAILADGRLACWGYHTKPLGRVSAEDVGGASGEITGLAAISFTGNKSPVRAVSTSEDHACAVLEDGTAWCWGNNTRGQLGTETADNTDSPRAVVFGDIKGRPVDIHAGYYHTCALLDDNTVACWGCNDSSQLALRTDDDSLKNFGDSCAAGVDRPVLAAQVNAMLKGEVVAQLVAGGSHNCVHITSGSVYCWGANDLGQLSASTSPIDSASPIEVVLGEKALQISSSANQTCAVLDTGDIVCWGQNREGQLGTGECNDEGNPPQLVVL